MKHSTGSPTIAQQKRFESIQEIGCICCALKGKYNEPCEIHHLIDGYRLGHDYTIGLCPYHHRGVSLGRKGLYRIVGPSLAVNPEDFHGQFGTDDELLEMQNMLIEKLNEMKRWVNEPSRLE